MMRMPRVDHDRLAHDYATDQITNHALTFVLNYEKLCARGEYLFLFVVIYCVITGLSLCVESFEPEWHVFTVCTLLVACVLSLSCILTYVEIGYVVCDPWFKMVVCRYLRD